MKNSGPFHNYVCLPKGISLADTILTVFQSSALQPRFGQFARTSTAHAGFYVLLARTVWQSPGIDMR